MATKLDNPSKIMIGSAIIVISILLIYYFGYNYWGWFGGVKSYASGGRINNSNINRVKKQIQGIYDSTGSPVGGYNQKKNTCSASCAESGAVGWGVEQYPKDSIYYPHYWCYCIMAAQTK